MKTAQRHCKKQLPASFRRIGLAIGLASLMIVAGCGSQPSFGDQPYRYVSEVEQCRDGSIMVCEVNSRCRCHLLDEEQDRIQRASMRGQMRRGRPRH
jgi:hypothetical protein